MSLIWHPLLFTRASGPPSSALGLFCGFSPTNQIWRALHPLPRDKSLEAGRCKPDLTPSAVQLVAYGGLQLTVNHWISLVVDAVHVPHRALTRHANCVRTAQSSCQLSEGIHTRLASILALRLGVTPARLCVCCLSIRQAFLWFGMACQQSNEENSQQPCLSWPGPCEWWVASHRIK